MLFYGVHLVLGGSTKKNEMSKESAFYLLLTLLAFALMGCGWYLLDLGGAVNATAGLVSLLTGFVIGLVLYGEKLSWWD